MAYPDALRQRVLAHYDEGVKTKQIAFMLKVSPAWCRRVKQNRDKPRPKIGGKPFKIAGQNRLQFEQFVEQRPDSTLEELQKRVLKELHLKVSIGTIWATLRRLKLTLKKSL
jgi:transposase